MEKKIKKSIHDYYCHLCKKYHKYFDDKDKDRLINFHTEWKDKKKAEEQIKKNKEAEAEHKRKFKH